MGPSTKLKPNKCCKQKKANFSLLAKVREHNLAADVFIELFERLIIPVLLYGSEVWGYEDSKQLQVMCNNVMRRFLKLHKTTPVNMLIGELGTKEVTEYIDNRMLNFWFNIATGEESKISTLLYKWVKVLYDKNNFKLPWLDSIKSILDGIGMHSIFNNIANVNKVWFTNTIKENLNDSCILPKLLPPKL